MMTNGGTGWRGVGGWKDAIANVRFLLHSLPEAVENGRPLPFENAGRHEAAFVLSIQYFPPPVTIVQQHQPFVLSQVELLAAHRPVVVLGDHVHLLASFHWNEKREILNSLAHKFGRENIDIRDNACIKNVRELIGKLTQRQSRMTTMNNTCAHTAHVRCTKLDFSITKSICSNCHDLQNDKSGS